MRRDSFAHEGETGVDATTALIDIPVVDVVLESSLRSQ